MFRKFLQGSQDFSQAELFWVKKINGLIRVVIFDEDVHKAYVVIYSEQKNKYTLNAFCTTSGESYWSTDVPNGGYGSPSILKNYVVMLTEFTNITGICKDSGMVKWTFTTNSRIRSSVNIINNKIYFSSGGALFELNAQGELLNQWDYPKAFFYGTIDIVNELIVTLGVVNDEFCKSVIKVFAFHKSGPLVYELPICNGAVTSTDTSGIAWHQNIGYVGSENLITAFQGISGKVLWQSRIEGCAGRQVCTVDDNHVYYVTQSGNFGALSILNGASVWKIHTNDSLLVTPISVSGDKVFVAADAHLLVLRACNGQLLQKIPVGHSPYSMLSLSNGIGILGAGEPPHNGLLCCFKLQDMLRVIKYSCLVQTSNANIENPWMDIVIQIFNSDELISEAVLDGGIFCLKEPLYGLKINEHTFNFRIPIPVTMCPGDFVIMLNLNLLSGKTICRPIAIKLTRRKPLPSRTYLQHIPDVIEEKKNYSGAAIAVALQGLYGNKSSTQTNVREMIDAVKDLSGYEPFQAWRIILRRVLTSIASDKHELPEFREINNKITKNDFTDFT